MSLLRTLRRLVAGRPPVPELPTTPHPSPPEPAPAPAPAPTVVVVPADLEPDIPRGLTVAAGYAWRLAALVLAALGLFWLMAYFSAVTVPVAIAILLAAMLFPVASFLVRAGWPPVLAAVSSLLGMLLVVAGLLTFVGQQVAGEWPALVDQSAAGFSALLAWLGSLPFGIDEARLDEWFDQGLTWLRQQASSMAMAAASVGAAFGSFFAGLATALVAAFFFVAQGRRIWRGSVDVMLPPHYRERADQAALRGWASLVAYMRSAVIVAAVDAAGVALAALVLQVPLVAALFALTFFLSFIPIVGATVAGFVAVLLALVTHGWVTALLMLGAVILVMQLEGTFLQPLVMGKAVDLHPLAVLLGITAGAVISGVLGALLAIPVLAFGVAFVRALRRPDELDPVRQRPRLPSLPRRAIRPTT